MAQPVGYTPLDEDTILGDIVPVGVSNALGVYAAYYIVIAVVVVIILIWYYMKAESFTGPIAGQQDDDSSLGIGEKSRQFFINVNDYGDGLGQYTYTSPQQLFNDFDCANRGIDAACMANPSRECVANMAKKAHMHAGSDTWRGFQQSMLSEYGIDTNNEGMPAPHHTGEAAAKMSVGMNEPYTNSPMMYNKMSTPFRSYMSPDSLSVIGAGLSPANEMHSRKLRMMGVKPVHA